MHPVGDELHQPELHAQVSNNTIGLSHANDPPNTIYELALPYVYKTTITSSLTGGFPDGVGDSVSRTLIVDFSSDGPGGSIPCSVVPTGYQQFWNGLFEIANDGSITVGAAGGSPWVAGATVGLDAFINATHNNTGMVKFGFQATTPGVTGSVEPNWVVSCPVAGNTCADGTAVWTNIGYIGDQGPGYDLFHFDPARGCRYVNTRRGKVFNGTNEGPNWPSAGTPDAAGQWMTDDAETCFKMGGTNCGTGGTVNFTDIATLHGAGQYHQGRYGHFTPTGAGAKNTNYVGGSGDTTQAATGNGSCTPTISWTNFHSWPNMLFVSGTSYTNGEWVASPVDHNFYKLTGTTGTYTTDPSADSAHWQYNSYYCYNYIVDWYSNIIRPELEVGPIFGADGHGSGAYNLDFRGGKYISHYLSKPQCDNNATGTCAGQYVGAPQNPGVFALTLSLPADGHPSYTNEGLNNGQHDLQPIMDATGSAFNSAGVSRMPSYGGTPGNSPYTAAGYDEILAFSTDGLQTLYRFGSTYNSSSNTAFAAQIAQSSVSQDGKMFAWCSDFMNTRGDTGSGSATCANPVVIMYTAATGGCVALNDYVNSTALGTTAYQITSLGSATQGACAPLYTAGTVPTWSSCATVGQVCTDSVGVQYTNKGVNSCRPDVAVMDLTSANPATSTIINAASCSSANVLSAIALASNGDTVVVPAGTCTWTTPSGGGAPTINLTKSITLQGATTCSGSPITCTDGTIINDGTGNAYNENLINDNADNSRITGFSFKDPRNLSDSKYSVQLACSGCRFDHNSVTQANAAGATHGIYVFSSPSGTQLVDHNYFANLNGAADVDGSASDAHYPGDTSWASSLTLGSANATYIENNNFTCNYAAVACPLDGAYDAYAGARLVFRFNTATNLNLGGHGLDSGGLRSTLLQEVYGNTFTNTGASNIYLVFGTRGGTHLIFNNTVSASGGSYGSFMWLQNYRGDPGCGGECGGFGVCTGSNSIDQNSSGGHGYRCRDGVGSGPETAPASDWPVVTSSPSYSEGFYPGYSWGNNFKGSAPTTGDINICGYPCSGDTNVSTYQILNNRDFYMEAAGTCTSGGSCTAGVGSGTTLPTSCTTGVGFWKTNEGSWNTTLSPNTSGLLYKCTSTNTWNLYYTPYTYPHP